MAIIMATTGMGILTIARAMASTAGGFFRCGLRFHRIIFGMGMTGVVMAAAAAARVLLVMCCHRGIPCLRSPDCCLYKPSHNGKVKPLGGAMKNLLQIGEASMESEVSAKMIRYYEQIGLIVPPARSNSGYRHYSQNDVHQLQFVHRARELGFSIEAIRELLRLWRDRQRPSRDVKRLALQHVAEMEAQIERMKGMAQTLKHLAEACDGDSRPHCPILRDLSGDSNGKTAGQPIK